MAGQALNETNQRVPGEDAHTCILLRSQNGHKGEIRLLAAHGMQCPLDALGIARDDGEVGFGRLVGLRAALFPIPQSSKRDSESCGKFLLGQREGAAKRFDTC